MQFVYQRTPAAWPLVTGTEGVTGEREVVVVKVIDDLYPTIQLVKSGNHGNDIVQEPCVNSGQLTE